MAKAKNARSARKETPAARSPRRPGRAERVDERGAAESGAGRKTASTRGASRVQPAAIPRGVQNRRRGDKRRAVQVAGPGRGTRPSGDARTHVPQETEGRTSSSRVVEAAAKPGLAGVERSAARGRYVYCIIRAHEPLRFGAIGMDVKWPEVYAVNYQDLAAVASDVSTAPLDSTRENVLAHERVNNEAVMRDHTVIPMSFGAIFKTHEDIVELLRSAYDAFSDVLKKMEDKLEFGLKVLWDRNEIVRLIEQEDEDIHRLKSEISSQKGFTYFARMQYGRMIDDALQQRSERYVTELLQRLRDVSVASRVNRPIGDKMIMNAAFLVQRKQEDVFDRRIEEIASAFDTLTFKCTGPWPPYNFVNIRLKLERAGH